MLWTVLWWAGGVAGGIAALWLLASAAGLDKPRRALRGRDGTLSCGACGHEAVQPDTIARCPECGAEYAKAGLLTPRAGLRYGPPVWVVAVMLMGLVILGSAMLAPVAGQAANRWAIGGSQIEERRMTASFTPAVMPGAPTTSGMPEYWLGVHTDMLIAGSRGTWTPNPPELSGSLEIELIAGSGSRNGPQGPGAAALPRYRLLAGFTGDAWRIVDASNRSLASGDDGLEAGVARLYELAGVAPGQAKAWPGSADEMDAAQQIARLHADAAGGRVRLVNLPGPYGLQRRGNSTTSKSISTFHRASPWGFAAGVATPVGLLAVALILLGAIGWLRRRMVR